MPTLPTCTLPPPIRQVHGPAMRAKLATEHVPFAPLG
jgi:hypothetical protein